MEYILRYKNSMLGVYDKFGNCELEEYKLYQDFFKDKITPQLSNTLTYINQNYNNLDYYVETKFSTFYTSIKTRIDSKLWKELLTIEDLTEAIEKFNELQIYLNQIYLDHDEDVCNFEFEKLNNKDEPFFEATVGFNND